MHNSPPFFTLEINGDAFFSALHPEKNTQLRTAHRITAVLFNLDDTRAKIRKQPICEWTRHVGTEIQHQHPVHRTNSRGERREGGSARASDVSFRWILTFFSPLTSFQDRSVVLSWGGDLAPKLDRRPAKFRKLA